MNRTFYQMKNQTNIRYFFLTVQTFAICENDHGKIVEKDCQAHGLNREDAMDHIRWMKQIRDD